MRLAFYFWAQTAVPHLGILPHEIVVVSPGAPVPIRVIGRSARVLATNYGVIAGELTDGHLVALTNREATELAFAAPVSATRRRRRRPDHLRLV